MRISDWSSDVCSSDLLLEGVGKSARQLLRRGAHVGVRYFSDFFAPKLPAAKKTRNAGNGATSFHQDRSEERRVGKECVSPCRSRWSPYHEKTQQHQSDETVRISTTMQWYHRPGIT